MEEQIQSKVENIDKLVKVKNIAITYLINLLIIFYMEIVVKISIYNTILDIGTLYIFIFSVAVAGLITFINMLFNKRLISIIITSIIHLFLAFYFSFYLLYYNFFKTFFVWITVDMADDVMAFPKEILSIITNNYYYIIIMFIPAIIYIIYLSKKKTYVSYNTLNKVGIFIISVIFYLGGVGLINLDSETKSVYYDTLQPVEYVKRFGVLQTTKKDIIDYIFENNEPSLDLEEAKQVSNTELIQSQEDYDPNIMDIDFEELIKNESNKTIKELHKYFSTVEPSYKNEYTGMFKGKNLIFLTLEGFSYKVIDKELTPTLYKMFNEGFVFENFYTSLWGGSTATGEYTATTGNFYNNAKCLEISSNNYLPFTMGNQFKKLGYTTLAYHNNSYTYYKRNLSHPNMGYEYIGIGNGLTGLTDVWPRSDEEMAEATIGQFIDKEPFHVYYMTVSGHANYSWSGNNMCRKHKAEVKNLNKSETIKAYYACQLEVENMLTTLVEALDEKGILENTVFAMSADHYPYALKNSELAELYDLPEENLDSNFDLYRNAFILWSASMEEPVIISKPCSSIDIIPTLSNLFGLEYDSRLIMGTDILSNSENIAIINFNGAGGYWNWITEQGKYYSSSKKFIQSEECNLNDDEIEEYVDRINKIVSNKESASLKVLNNDYYRYVFKNN